MTNNPVKVVGAIGPILESSEQITNFRIWKRPNYISTSSINQSTDLITKRFFLLQYIKKKELIVVL